MKTPLTVDKLCEEARIFADHESKHHERSLYGVTDGKAVGTYLEHKFRDRLQQKYAFEPSSSAKGIDFPELGVDTKVTSITQPQSSCPFTTARQKVYGLGYSLLLFVYEKSDSEKRRTARLNIMHAVFIEKKRTADYQMTTGLLQILKNNGNEDDLVAFMMDKNLPADDVQARKIAKEILKTPPEVGYLTISNALQWRLQYGRVIEQAGKVGGIIRVR